jgi:hypothetical protein
MIGAWLAVFASAASRGSRAYGMVILGTDMSGRVGVNNGESHTVGRKARPKVLAFAQREAVEARLIAAGSGFALATAGHGRVSAIRRRGIWRRAAALLAV